MGAAAQTAHGERGSTLSTCEGQAPPAAAAISARRQLSPCSAAAEVAKQEYGVLTHAARARLTASQCNTEEQQQSALVRDMAAKAAARTAAAKLLTEHTSDAKRAAALSNASQPAAANVPAEPAYTRGGRRCKLEW